MPSTWVYGAYTELLTPSIWTYVGISKYFVELFSSLYSYFVNVLSLPSIWEYAPLTLLLTP